MSKRYLFQKNNRQTTAYLLMEHNEPHVSVPFDPQIPRKDGEETREWRCDALLTLFISWRTVHDLCGMNQTWEDAFTSHLSLIAPPI